MLKCKICYLILSENDLIEDKCPECQTTPVPMCSGDKICHCHEDLSSGTQICPICKEFTCPCGSHDCSAQSRITGYIGALSAWNSGKMAEFIDRTRYDPFSGDIVPSGIS